MLERARCKRRGGEKGFLGLWGVVGVVGGCGTGRARRVFWVPSVRVLMGAQIEHSTGQNAGGKAAARHSGGRTILPIPPFFCGSGAGGVHPPFPPPFLLAFLLSFLLIKDMHVDLANRGLPLGQPPACLSPRRLVPCVRVNVSSVGYR